jgi:hypothetical protein
VIPLTQLTDVTHVPVQEMVVFPVLKHIVQNAATMARPTILVLLSTQLMAVTHVSAREEDLLHVLEKLADQKNVTTMARPTILVISSTQLTDVTHVPA